MGIVKSIGRKLSHLLPDKTYLQLKYRMEFGKALDLKNPKTFNEKLQWLKLYNRNPEFSKMVDKYEVKKYVANIIGEEHIIPTIGVWDKFDEIDFDALPDQFVLKCTHDSGGLVVCTDKSKLDKEAAKKKIEASLKINYYYHGREWPYKNVKPRIIAEQYMPLEGDNGIEYKLFTFHGETKIILICKGKAHSGGRTNDYLDENFNRIPVTCLYPHSTGELVCPAEMVQMKELARTLSKDIPQLRVDFYLVNGQIYFGELTFFHNSGMCQFDPPEYDQIFGSYIALPDKK